MQQCWLNLAMIALGRTFDKLYHAHIQNKTFTEQVKKVELGMLPLTEHTHTHLPLQEASLFSVAKICLFNTMHSTALCLLYSL